MNIRFSEIEEQEFIRLRIHKGESQFALGATVKRHLTDEFTLVALDYSGEQTLVFNNVTVDVEYFPSGDVPLVWKNIKVISQKNMYVLQVNGVSMRNNRRDSFRLSVAKMALMKRPGERPKQVMVKEVSLSGFSITDSKKELNLEVGDQVLIFFEDWGYQMNLDGRVVRLEEREDVTIYGFSIRNLCKDLSLYINDKQRRTKRNNG